MKLIKIQNYFKLVTDLRFAIFVLAIIAVASSLGSIIEQDETIVFYQQNYSKENPIYGFIDANFLLFFGLDHIYNTWWFFSLLLILGISLIGCTITRQFPLFLNSKDYFFKKGKKSFSNLPFFVRLENKFYLKEIIIIKIQKMNFFIYQKGNFIYGYKGLIGRISPILVHFSLIIILSGSWIGAFQNFKAQEILPKDEVFHIQNPIKIGYLTHLPNLTARVNDFWVEYENNRIHQFYSNISILDNFGKEIKEQTISVNNPLRYNSIDFYQSDWNLLGIRIENSINKKIEELPVFSLNKISKSWITWISLEGLEGNNNSKIKQNFTLIFDQLQNVFFVYDQQGNFLNIKNIGEFVTPEIKILEILPSTGLLIKYDPSIRMIYFGFGLLMITSTLSYLPYTQIWILNQSKKILLGCITNRGKIQLEIEFENLIRDIENSLQKKNLKV